MAVDQLTVHIQIVTRDQHGFTNTAHETTYVLDDRADEIADQLDAITTAAVQCKAEWADLGNPLSLF
jgi:hypothetical protein